MMKRPNRFTLSDVMDFDHVIEVLPDGSVVDRPDIYAPQLYAYDLDDDGEDFEIWSGWTLLDGWSMQDRYSGPAMHQSEFIGGALADHILETPGVYVTLVVYPLDADQEPTEWAVARLDES